MRVKEGSEKKWLKTQHSKKYFMASGPITSWQTDGEAMESVKDIIFPKKVHLVKAMVFPVVMYGCESWTIKKIEH